MKIRVSVSQTLNIGNYESIRPGVEIEDDINTPEEYVRMSVKAHKLWELHANTQLNTIAVQRGVRDMAGNSIEALTSAIEHGVEYYQEQMREIDMERLKDIFDGKESE